MKTVLITGASSGIGRQLALDYAREGHNVIACGRSLTKLSELTDRFDTIHPAVFDTTQPEQIQQAIDSLDVMPDIWILNAGDCKYVDDGKLDAEVIAQVMNVNFMGTVNCLAVIQAHIKPGDHIVMTGSIASVLGLPRSEAYGASKAALHYLFRSLQQDWQARDVKLSFIMPGFVKTPLTDKNTFPMPMRISVDEASQAIMRGIQSGDVYIYFPKKFTWFIRIIGFLPFEWQRRIISRLVKA